MYKAFVRPMIQYAVSTDVVSNNSVISQLVDDLRRLFKGIFFKQKFDLIGIAREIHKKCASTVLHI